MADLDDLDTGGVLALDLASTVGWAYGRTTSNAGPAFGAIGLPKTGGEGARYACFQNELIPMLERLEPKSMIVEKHLPLPAMNNVQSARQQLGLLAIALSEAWRYRIAVNEIDAVSVRMEVLGYAYPRKGSDIKQSVVAYCRSRGWFVPDHNAADACLIWEWHRRRVHAPEQRTMFWLRTAQQ